MESGFIELQTQRVHFLIGGEGQTVILLPSHWLSSYSYQLLGELLTPYYRVVIPDIYKGRSVFSGVSGSFKDQAEILNILIKKLKINEFHLIGISFSGLIVLEYFRNFPQNLKKVLLFSTTVAPVLEQNKYLKLMWGYVKLIYYNLRSKDKVKNVLLWIYDAMYFFLKHPRQFWKEPVLTVNYIQPDYHLSDHKFKLIYPLCDEFLPPYLLSKNREIKNLEIETVDDDHTWFFINRDLFIQKVREFFK